MLGAGGAGAPGRRGSFGQRFLGRACAYSVARSAGRVSSGTTAWLAARTSAHTRKLGRLRAGTDSELAERPLEMLADGAVAHVEFLGHVPVRAPERDEAHHLGLARGQAGRAQRRRERRRIPEPSPSVRRRAACSIAARNAEIEQRTRTVERIPRSASV